MWVFPHSCDNLLSYHRLVLNAQTPCLTLCWNYGSLSQCLSSSCVLNSVLSWQILFPDFTEEKAGLSSVCRLTPRHHMGCELQAHFKAWSFLTTLLCLATWESKKSSFLPNRCQKSLSGYPDVETPLGLAGSEPMSLHLKVNPIPPSVLTSSCCILSNRSPAPAQASDEGPSISERPEDLGPCSLSCQTLGTTPKYSGNL